MKTLKFICNHHPEYDKIIPHVIGRTLINGCQDWRHYVDGVYLHGLLEDLNHYDCVDLIDFEGLSTYEEGCDKDKILRCNLPEGINSCEVYGYDKPCTSFIWYYTLGQYKRWRGLIVANDDIEAYNDAKNKYEARKTNL